LVAGEALARLRSRSETMPTSVSCSTTGRWGIPRLRTSRIAHGSDVFGVIVITAACITSSTSISLLLSERSAHGSSCPTLSLRAVERDGHGRLSEYLLGHASEDDSPDAAPAARRHRDEVGVPGLGLVQDLLDRF